MTAVIYAYSSLHHNIPISDEKPTKKKKETQREIEMFSFLHWKWEPGV